MQLENWNNDRSSPALRGVPQADTCRDTIAKLLYSKMFEWLVSRINSGLFTKSASCTIHILDIFGFEDFAHNTFEQLCINYANEKLHSLFVDAVLKTEQEEYRREGLVFKRVDFVNNDATVAPLDGTGGILRTLEDVCRWNSFWTSFFIFEA